MNNQTSGRLSPVQEAVQIVQNMIQAGMDPRSYEGELERLHKLMQEFAYGQVKLDPPVEVASVPGTEVPSLDVLLGDDFEDDPCTLAYWAATSAFFRKVYQAAAAAA